METDIHDKDLALRLVLKERPRATRKWPISLTAMEFISTNVLTT